MMDLKNQSPRDFLDGQMLIAMPNMADPRFEQSIILVCAHTDEHAMGVVVNKTLKDVTLGRLVEELGVDVDAAAAHEPILFGGPVDTDRGVVVHTMDYQTSQTVAVTPTIGLTGSKQILIDMASGDATRAPKQALLALGYAGWGAGQLEKEIGLNAWLNCPVDLDLIFATPFEDKWRTALSSLGVTDAMFSAEWSETRDNGGVVH